MKKKSIYAIELEKLLKEICNEALNIIGDEDDDDIIKNSFRKKCRMITWEVNKEPQKK